MSHPEAIPPTSISVTETGFSVIAMLYLALIPLNIPLVGPCRLHDLVAVAFVVALVIRRRDWGRFLELPDRLLALFAVLSVLATACHAFGVLDVYELAIFGYMILLYLFFSRTHIPPRWLLRYAIAVAAGCWAVGLYQIAAGNVPTHAAYQGTVLGFLARRYQFTFANPNMLGSFLALPVLCFLLGAARDRDPQTPGSRSLYLAAAVALFVPLLLTGSRHVLLSGALTLGFLSARFSSARPRLTKALAWAAFASVAILFLVTILYPFFPLQSAFPFFNHRVSGMYTIHQSAYARMLFLDLRAFFLGVGRTDVHALYPTLVDPEMARAILSDYRMAALTDTFLTYMDAHNEYLNTATSFGVPALAVLYAFVIAQAVCFRRGAEGTVRGMMVFFAAALLVVSLWDDILSKRWIWVILGLLVAHARKADGHSAAALPMSGPVGATEAPP